MSNTARRRVSRYRLSSSVRMVLKRSLKTLLTLRSTLCRDTSRPSLDAWSMKVCRPRISGERRGVSERKTGREEERGKPSEVESTAAPLYSSRAEEEGDGGVSEGVDWKTEVHE